MNKKFWRLVLGGSLAVSVSSSELGALSDDLFEELTSASTDSTDSRVALDRSRSGASSVADASVSIGLTGVASDTGLNLGAAAAGDEEWLDVGDPVSVGTADTPEKFSAHTRSTNTRLALRLAEHLGPELTQRYLLTHSIAGSGTSVVGETASEPVGSDNNSGRAGRGVVELAPDGSQSAPVRPSPALGEIPELSLGAAYELVRVPSFKSLHRRTRSLSADEGARLLSILSEGATIGHAIGRARAHTLATTTKPTSTKSDQSGSAGDTGAGARS